MMLARRVAPSFADPFPVYRDLAETLLTAHLRVPLERDSTVAHVLATCAGYAYADAETVSTMMARLGLFGHGCVRISQVVDSMFIYSTAYLLQSRCGRVVIVCYRGTEPGELLNWLGDVDVGPESSKLLVAEGLTELRVHGGFHRNLRATWWPVLDELGAALAGKSLADRRQSVPGPLEAIYVCGHSLGGAMALLFMLKLAGDVQQRALAERVRALYTFGQPMTVLLPVSPTLVESQRSVFRHVLPEDPVPALPAGSWGPFVHLGHEYRWVEGEWRRSAVPVEQLPTMRQVPRIVLSLLDRSERRKSGRYSFAAHGPQHYLSALRPGDRVTEFGDRDAL